MVDRVGNLLRWQADIHSLQHGAHHRDRKKRFKKSVAVPVQHSDRIAGPHAGSCKRGGQATDPPPELAVREPFQVSINDLLIGGLEKRGMPQMLDDQRVLIGRLSGRDDPARHGILRTISQPRGA